MHAGMDDRAELPQWRSGWFIREESEFQIRELAAMVDYQEISQGDCQGLDVVDVQPA